jgi:hypothetical protein
MVKDGHDIGEQRQCVVRQDLTAEVGIDGLTNRLHGAGQITIRGSHGIDTVRAVLKPMGTIDEIHRAGQAGVHGILR